MGDFQKDIALRWAPCEKFDMSGYHNGEVEAELLCHRFLPVAIISSWLYSWKNPVAESDNSGGERIGCGQRAASNIKRRQEPKEALPKPQKYVKY